GMMAADGGTAKDFKRYEITESGVSPRALPGTKGYQFIGATDEHMESGELISDVLAGLPEVVEERRKMHEKRMRKLDGLRKDSPPPEMWGSRNADLTLISWGSTWGAAHEAILQVEEKEGMKVNSVEFPTIFPFHVDEAQKLLRAVEHPRRLGHRLLEQPPAFPVDVRVPCDPWPRAPGRGGRQAREPGAERHRHRRGRRRIRDRPRPLHPRDAPELRHHLRRHEQPDLRPHDRPGEPDLGEGHEDEVDADRRRDREPDRPDLPGPRVRRDLCGPRLQRGREDDGGARQRRDRAQRLRADRLPLAVRHVQQGEHLRLLPRARVRSGEGRPRSERHEGGLREGDRVADGSARPDPSWALLSEQGNADLRGPGDFAPEGPSGPTAFGGRGSGGAPLGVPLKEAWDQRNVQASAGLNRPVHGGNE